MPTDRRNARIARNGPPAEDGVNGVRWLVMAIVAGVFVFFGMIVWYAYQEFVMVTSEPLLVRADPEPFKRPPSERGGLPLLNEDSAMVRALEEGDVPRVERILPREEWVPRSAEEALTRQPPAQPARETPRGEGEGPQPTPAAPERESAPPAPAPRQTASATPQQPREADAGIGHRLQLVALRDRDAAREAWKIFKDAYPAVLGPLEPTIEPVETDNGTFFRLHAGSFDSREAAITACETLQARGGECFVVGPPT